MHIAIVLFKTGVKSPANEELTGTTLGNSRENQMK